MNMKELYIAPELNVLCFAPSEKLANISFDNLLASGEKGEAVVPSDTDISIDLTL